MTPPQKPENSSVCGCSTNVTKTKTYRRITLNSVCHQNAYKEYPAVRRNRRTDKSHSCYFSLRMCQKLRVKKQAVISSSVSIGYNFRSLYFAHIKDIFQFLELFEWNAQLCRYWVSNHIPLDDILPVKPWSCFLTLKWKHIFVLSLSPNTRQFCFLKNESVITQVAGTAVFVQLPLGGLTWQISRGSKGWPDIANRNCKHRVRNWQSKSEMSLEL